MADDPDGKLFGAQVSPQPALKPSTEVDLQGKYVTLTALSDTHLTALWKHLNPLESPSLWSYLPCPAPQSADELRDTFKHFDTRGFIQFTILANPNLLSPRASSQHCPSPTLHTEPLGVISFLDVVPANRTLEVGGVIFSPLLQRTAAATEVHYLLLRLAFEGFPAGSLPVYRRATWKCHVKNLKSRRAAERLGYVYEGTLRNHMIVRGRSRDSDYLSIIEEEWKGVKKGFEEWLEEGNFDMTGKQIRTLTACRQRHR